MTREMLLAIMIAIVLALIALAVWAWLRRTRRDAGLPAPYAELPPDTEVLSMWDALYVATTRHDQPLERLAMRGLGFRSRVGISVTTAGVALDLTGQARMLIPRDRIQSVGLATVAIDRVVERDGLVKLAWRPDDSTVVDTYLRAQTGSSRSLADAIGIILTPSTGTDA
ncbi:MAG: hypothetical protein ABWY37_04510 [Microbacterium pygmaeum]